MKLSEEFKEYEDFWATSSQPAQASLQTSNTSYKDKFKKLLQYHINNHPKTKTVGYEVINYMIEELWEDSNEAYFWYWEERNYTYSKDVEKFDIEARYIKDTKKWKVGIWLNGHLCRSLSGNSFNNLIDALSANVSVPLRTSKEWQELLE